MMQRSIISIPVRVFLVLGKGEKELLPACVPILSGPSVFFSRMSLRLAGRGVRYNMLFEKRHKHIVICISVEILRGRTPAAER
mmetsp:Transcript_7161/g.11249  ORF Transcript_7161/g.11249 Transcript_7161/m.11249 type:complete len:83 (+) Transcript_7161:186-434(+)